jgi:ParB family chromosome partitioning protein
MPTSYLSIDLVHPHPNNIRHAPDYQYKQEIAELAASIRSKGILQPLVVQPYPGRPGHYRLIAGHRRLEAADSADCDTVPVIVRHGLSDQDVLELMLIENCQRRQLNPMEQAEALDRLRRERNMTASEVAVAVGMAPGSVSRSLALLELAPATRELVRSGELKPTVAVEAVREVRKRRRRSEGSTATWEWERPHLSKNHPLAPLAKKLCDGEGHGTRRRVGGIACGQCWEQAIRQDERARIASNSAAGGAAA